MTKKLPSELDLDSFLSLHSDSDEDSASVPHRTLDEILNQSDSSTSPSPPSSPLSLKLHHTRLSDLPPRFPQVDAVSDDSTESLKLAHSLNFPDQNRFNSVSRVNSAVFPGDPVWRVPSSSKPLPSLFGVVRSNAKPGAALAAAAAASRSVPTPHAAAIKSRRAVTLQKALDAGESTSLLGDDNDVVSNSSAGDSNGAVIERTKSNDSNGVVIGRPRSNDELAEEDDNMGNFQLAVENEVTSEVFSNKDLEGELETSHKIDKQQSISDQQDRLNTVASTFSSNVELDFDGSSANVCSDERNNEVLSNKSHDGNPKFVHLNGSCELGTAAPCGDHEGGEIQVHSAMVPLEGTDNLEDGKQTFKDDSADIAADVDGETSSLSDIAELVEERIGQLESERISRKAEKKLRLSKKPLELAEELEIKQASTGFHWEEGAAAQPMKLEGVRRGSTTLGYFDVDVNNTITRTIGSQAFRRDHGSQQVLAVHLNYIAVGMAKGVIAVFPSRYAPHTVDNMDSKVASLCHSTLFFGLLQCVCSLLLLLSSFLS